MVLARFLRHLWSQIGPFSRHFGLERGKNFSTWAQNGLIPLVCAPQMVQKYLWKNTFLTHFWCQNNPFSRHFVTLEWPKWLAMGSKWAHFTCLGTPNGLGSVFGKKHVLDPVLIHFWSQNSPFSRHFGILGGPKRATVSSKGTKNTCFGIPCGLGSSLKKVFFLHQVDLVDPVWHPALWATSCSLPQPTGPRYGV